MRAFWLDLHEKPRPVANPEDTRNRYQTILAQADWEEPLPQRGKPKNSVGRSLLNRLTEHADGVLAFALEVGVPFTHNQSERDLRSAKVKAAVFAHSLAHRFTLACKRLFRLFANKASMSLLPCAICLRIARLFFRSRVGSYQ